VGYHFTGNSVKGSSLKGLIATVIEGASNIGLQVVAVTSDMGPANQAMWKEFGVCSKRENLISFIANPSVPNQRLHFLADVPHLVKNLCTSFLTHKTFVLDNSISENNNLTSNKVCLSHIIALAEFQSKKALKLAPKLKLEMFQSASHFRKMNVGNALNIFSKSVSAGLRYLVQEQEYSKDLLTTAWYVDAVDTWFNLMSSRHPVNALSQKHLAAYETARNHLTNFMTTTHQMQIGEKLTWKPVQSGIMLTTTSVLNICDDLLDDKLDFLLTSRLTQDCVENLFSVVRSRKPVPSAREFKYALKLICVAQYLKPVRGSNYDLDDREYLGDLLPPVIVPPEPEATVDLTNVVITVDQLLCSAEEQSLYYLAGYCVQSLKKLNRLCTKCIRILEHTDSVPHKHATLLRLKNFKDGALWEVNDKVYQLFSQWELVLRSTLRTSNNLAKVPKLGKVLYQQCKEVATADEFHSPCHPVVERLITKFVNVRLHIFCATTNNDNKSNTIPHGSKSMAMRALAKRL